MGAETIAGRRRPSVAIVGAGFGGLGIAIRLKRAGFDDFTIFERGGSAGGVWRANTYPGAACDVPSHLYSFSFAPGHRWSRRYAPQIEILEYLEGLVDEFGLRSHLRLNTEVSQAEFDADPGRWLVTTEPGGTSEFDLLVTACGQLTTPAVPPLPGIEDFDGTAFHSATWNHDHDLNGRDVAVIGTGASAIQFAPEIAPKVRSLTIYQRSAPWILPKPDREYASWERRLFRAFPPRVAASRAGLFAVFEVATHAFTDKRWIFRPYRARADRMRRRELTNPRLLEAATPDYDMGCKRVLFSSAWYETLMRNDVELVAAEIERVSASGVVADGRERPADTIIWGTGFRSQDFVAPLEVRGLGGRELNAVWADAPGAHYGMTVNGFPNLFVLYGPNTNHGSVSIPYMLECQFNYVLDAARRLRDGPLRYLDVRPEAQAGWQREIDERSLPTVWVTGGCESWYLDSDGHNTNNWPAGWLEYRRRTRRLDPREYELIS